MAITLNNLLHAKTEIKRIISNEFPHLQLVFVPFEKDETAKQALSRTASEFSAHPSRTDALRSIDAHDQTLNLEFPTRFGPFETEEKHPIPFLAKSEILAFCFVPMQAIPEEALQTEHYMLSAAYPFLNKLQSRLSSTSNIQKASSLADQAQQNMLSDIFASLLLALKSGPEIILDIAKAQSLKTLQATPNHHAEMHPYPMALDATNVIFEDLGKTKSRLSPVYNALKMTKEAEETLAAIPVQKWIDFASCAQQMAWSNHPEKNILGMAIHTSEDTYVRSIGHILADTLHIQPKLSTYFDLYNPYTESEANERHHKTVFKTLLKRILSHFEHNIAFDYDSEIIKQNKDLVKGRPLKWCAHALLAGMQKAQELKSNSNKANNEMSITKKVALLEKHLNDIFEEITWNEIEILFQKIVLYKRNFIPITGDCIVKIIHDNNLPHKELLENIFAPYGNHVIYDPKKEEELKQALEVGGLTLEEEPEKETTPEEETGSDFLSIQKETEEKDEAP